MADDVTDKVVNDDNELKKRNEKNYSKLKDLSLEEVLSYNFTMKDILTITRCSLKGKEPQTLKERILYIISKHIMLDYRSRNIELCITDNQLSENTRTSKCYGNDTEIQIKENELARDTDDDDDDDDEFKLSLRKDKGSQRKTLDLLHPSDVMFIIMNCCDNILRQTIIQKMAICQLAIPLVLPDLLSSEPLFLLWAMRHMQMNWKSKLNGTQNINPIDDPTPIVSAIRLGELSKSKSKILNDILCYQPHDIFFHRDCASGNYSRKLSDGVIELSWYLPGGKEEDKFDNAIAFANLRGDAKNHSKQLELLSKVSSTMLVFLSSQSIYDPECSSIIKMLSNSNLQLIFVFLGHIPCESAEQINEDYTKLMGTKKSKTVLESVNGIPKNVAKLTTDIIKKIKVSLKNHFETESPEKQLNMKHISDIALDIRIKVDEDNKSCNNGLNMTNTINELLNDNPQTRKENILQLQGNLWTEWCRLDKEQVNLNGVSPNNYETHISDIHSKKKACRKTQCKLVEEMNPVMENFIQNLIPTKDKDNEESRISFLQWMKLILDGISQKRLPELHMKYHSLSDDIQRGVDEKWNDDKIKATQNMLNEVQRNIISASFGLEHFMREVAQVYEAISDNENNTSTKLKEMYLLPQFAAELLISGFPLEIMDGDVSYVPLTWVNAVFDSLKTILGDKKKVYVISVLGVQSSGKSTLLNTMFGLNFAVSAGRCTKGVYAQLIPVDQHLSDELGYDYILVLDTEGIRAAELGDSKKNHDNALATLVIGLGDVTIINIKGENMAEIEDILQIAVHAFLRMKLVKKNIKLQPGCYFVHQNVPAVDADDKMLYGIKMVQKKLDDMAQAAVQLEHNSSGIQDKSHKHASDIQSFKDVIEFDVKNNVWYFSSLWQGDPPMAPANPSYSEKVLDLKTNLLQYPSIKGKNCLTITNLQHRISDLWDAIQNDDFVYSFKNTLAKKSYSRLEEKYASLSWDFRQGIKKWENDSNHEILYCGKKEMKRVYDSVESSLHSYIEKDFKKCKSELDKFFNSEDADILEEWKFSTEKRLESLMNELKSEAKKSYENHYQIRRAQFEVKNDSYNKLIQDRVKDLIETNFDEKMSEELLKKLFAENWNEWMRNLDFEIFEEKDIRGDVKSILNVDYEESCYLIQKQMKQIYTNESDIYSLPIINDEDYAPKPSFLPKWVGQISEKMKRIKERMHPANEINDLTHNIMKEIKKYLGEKENKDYKKTYLYEICHNVEQHIDAFNSGSQPYVLKINYKIKLLEHTLRNVIPDFEKMQREYRKKNDPQLYLEENLKPGLEKYFIDNYNQVSDEKKAANLLSPSLEKSINSLLMRDLPGIIAQNVRASDDSFHSKIKWYSKVLKDLGTDKDFDKYIRFLQSPHNSMESWLQKYVSGYCENKDANGRSRLVQEAIDKLKLTVTSLKNGVKEVNASVDDNGISFQGWLRRYKCNDNTKNIVTFDDNLFDILNPEKVKNFSFFGENIILSLDNIETKMKNDYRFLSVRMLDKPPHMLLANCILGCTEKCPFCYAICTSLIAGHDGKHSTLHHQPQGIGGVFNMHTDELILESCNVNVAGECRFALPACPITRCRCMELGESMHKFKEYHLAVPKWDIKPDTGMTGKEYWKWVFCQFAREFAKHYGKKVPNIPSAWKNITWSEAEKSITV